MPTFDLVLLFRKMDAVALKSVLTRSAKYVLESGGNLRRMENMGLLKTPFKIKKKGIPAQEFAHYFILNYDAGQNQNHEILDKCHRDLDVIRSTSYVESFYPGKKNNSTVECNIYEDSLPPPYRPSVIKLLQIGERSRNKLNKKKFKFNTGLDYDPF